MSTRESRSLILPFFPRTRNLHAGVLCFLDPYFTWTEANYSWITEVERSRPFLIRHVNIRKTLTHSSRDIWPYLERDKFSFCLSFDANFSSFSLAESQWQIFIKKLTRWLNDKTIIELGYRKLLQINYFDILGGRLFKPQPDKQSGS